MTVDPPFAIRGPDSGVTFSAVLRQGMGSVFVKYQTKLTFLWHTL
jgi:hypothetical protein